MTILADVQALGQQIWLDNLSRSLIKSGTLTQMLASGVAGVTSNPAIFQKAFASDELYIHDIEKLKQEQLSAKAIYETLAIADVQNACDVCRAEFDLSAGKRGFVSLEVSPEWANDTEQTVQEARRLYAAIQRPNVMIKIPATDAGLLALTELVADGLSINLTLLFSRKQTLKAYDAYMQGLKRRHQQGLDLSGIQVVASFFISRIDAALDATLPAHLQGQVAIALAKAAYQDWQQYFMAENWEQWHSVGGQRPQLLWASTGVKNPAYPATLYVDCLIGEHTVNTVPDATLKAFMQSGTAQSTLTQDWEVAQSILQEVEKLGIDLETLAVRLQKDGLEQFEQAFEQLLQPLA